MSNKPKGKRYNNMLVLTHHPAQLGKSLIVICYNIYNIVLITNLKAMIPNNNKCYWYKKHNTKIDNFLAGQLKDNCKLI